MSSFKSKLGLGVCAAVLSATGTPHVSAQSGGALLEELVVTAQRRETLLSETPIAMSAISQQGLREAGITDPTQLDSMVPGANFADSGDEGLRISIRGVYSNDSTEIGDQSAAFFYDGAYIARPQAQGLAFYDLARVEVLRGPQGTLFGRNSTAGLIHVISARPDEEFGASVDVTAASWGKQNITGMVNVPLTDRIKARAAFNIDETDGWIDYVGLNPDGFDHQPMRDVKSGRLSFDFDISDSVDLYVRADASDIGGTRYNEVVAFNIYEHDGCGCFNFVDSPGYGEGGPPVFERMFEANKNPTRRTSLSSDDLWVGLEQEPTTFGFGPTASIGDFTQANFLAVQPETRNSDGGIHAELNWAINDSLSMTYLGAVRTFERDEDWATVEGDNNWYFGESDTLSHELRFSYDTDRLNLQAGVYYFEEDGNLDFAVSLPGGGTVPSAYSDPNGDDVTDFDGRYWVFEDNFTSENIGVFAQGTYSLTDRLNLTVGVRYSEDEKTRNGERVVLDYNEDDPTGRFGDRVDGYIESDDGVQVVGGDVDGDGNGDVIEEVVGEDGNGDPVYGAPLLLENIGPITMVDDTVYKDDDVTWRLGLDYDSDFGLVYGTISTGYKSGGFNNGCEAGTPGCPEDLLTNDQQGFGYEPEELTAFEVGVKWRLFDDTLSIDAAAFVYDYENLQLSTVTTFDDGSTGRVTDNAESASINGAELTGSYYFSENTRLDFGIEYLKAEYDEFDPEDSTPQNFDGEPLDRAPDLVFTAGYNHVVDLDHGGNVVFDTRFRYSEQYVIADLDSEIFWTQPGYHTTDISVTYNAPGDRWYVAGFVTNLEDEIIVGDASTVPGNGVDTGYSTVELEQPQTFGVRAGMKF